MSNAVDALILDLLEWLDREPRTQAEVLDAWKTSCPGLPVWEEAIDRGLVERQHQHGRGPVITLTIDGRALLATRRKASEGPDKPAVRSR